MAGKLGSIGDAQDVFTLLHWLGVDRAPDGTTPTDAAAAAALVRLGERAGRTLQMSVDPARVTRAVLRAGEHRRAGGAW